MKKILVLCPYPKDVAPSQRLKFEQYYDSFRQANYKVTVSPFISLAFWRIIYKKGHFGLKVWHTLAGYWRRLQDLARIRSYDVVYIHLWVTPLGPTLFERLTRLLAKRVIFDIDDLVYLKDVTSKANPLISKLKGADKPLYLMRVADHVITCTPYLDSFVRKLNPNTTDISSTVDTDSYLPRKEYAIQQEKPVLGWSGSQSTSQYLYLLADVLKKVKEKVDFRLLVMGDASFSIDGLDVEAKAWSRDYELQTIARFDIGLYPLPDEEWVLGKSGLKAIQYMAMGIPTVATAIGANFRVIEDGKSGFLVKNQNEWEQRLLELIESPNLRESIGRQARRRVEENFSIQVNRKTYLDVLDKVLNKN